MAPSALVRGSINIDEFYAIPHIVRPGETIASTSYSRRLGGKGANQAIALARAAGTVSFSASVGTDGEALKEELRRSGVNVSQVQTVEEVTGRAIIQSSADGENSIILHPGANFAAQNTHIPPGTTHLVLQNEIPFESTFDYLRQAKSGGITSFFNPSPMPSNDQLRQFPWADLTWLLLNQGEASDIAQALDIDPSQRATAATDIIELLRNSTQFESVNIVCTLGANGVLISEANGAITAFPAVKLEKPLLDTTGAGDCFTGYFVAGIMREEQIDVVTKESLTACSICVESRGAAESIPARTAVLERLRTSGI